MMSQKQNKGQNLHHQTRLCQTQAIKPSLAKLSNPESMQGEQGVWRRERPSMVFGYGEVLEVAFLSCLFSIHRKTM